MGATDVVVEVTDKGGYSKSQHSLSGNSLAETFRPRKASSHRNNLTEHMPPKSGSHRHLREA